MIVTKFEIHHCRKFLAIFIFLLFPAHSLYAQFDGGEGSESDPWQISTVEQLQSIAEYLDAHFILTSDIDASSTAEWNDGLGFEPIGDQSSRFSGSLDGNGYIITGLTINRVDENYAGLFGASQNAALQNIHLLSADITARNIVGGLAGAMSGGTIEESSVTGTIFGERSVGGLTGELSQGEIRASYSAAAITGSWNVGGISGSAHASKIVDVYSLSNVTGEHYNVGGLAGMVMAEGFESDDFIAGLISGSFAAGSVEGDQEAGGLIGSVEWAVPVSGNEKHNHQHHSKLQSAEENTLITSYWDSVATGQPFAIGSEHPWENFDVDTIGLHTDQMSGHNAYIFMLDLDFIDTWKLTSGYPVLSWQEPDDVVEIPNVPRIIAESDNINFGVSGIGIEKSIHFTIKNTGNTNLNVNLSISGPDENLFSLDEADLSSTVPPDESVTFPVHFTPESEDSVHADLLIEHDAPNEESLLSVTLTGEGLEVNFAGGTGTEQDPWQIETLDQLNDIRLILHDHYILMNNLDASETSQWNNGEGFNPIGDAGTGFSGSFNGNDYEISGLFINRPDKSGVGLFGFMDNGTIKRVTLDDVQITGGHNTGSLIGFKRAGTVTDSHADGSIQGTETHTGGFIGYHLSGEVQNVSATVNVTGFNRTGGLIGSNGATITESWASGSVTGQNDVGGLTGRNGDMPPFVGIISQSYATVDVTGQERVGGFSGSHLNGEIEDVFATGNVSGEETVGGLIGNSLEPIMYAYAAATVDGASQVGGVAGLSSAFSQFSFTFWDTEVSGVSEATGSGATDGVTGATTIEMRQQSTFEGWDFDEVWAITEGETYPWLQQLGLPVSIESEEQPGETPRIAVLHQNYPNPFNPVTVIEFQLPETRDVTLEIFDITGRRLAVLVDDLRHAGQHRVNFDASGLASGVYFYRLTAGEFTRSRKMILVK